jgi:long-chain acyl-CoA synthetase
MVGIYSINRPEWVTTSIACTFQNLTYVPLYDTLGPDAAKYIVNHAELTTVVCSAKTFPQLAKCAPECPSLKNIIVMDPLEPKMRGSLPERVALYSWTDLLERGARSPRACVPVQPSDLLVIMYTSGTTGNPKGVMLTHANLIAAAAGLSAETPFASDDVYLSYLPLAHIFEQAVLVTGIYRGCRVGYWRGEVTLLLEDIQALRPTILIGVPRVFNRIYDRVMQQIAEGGFIKRTLFSIASNAKKAALETGGDTPVWNKLVFQKIRDAMGGRVRSIYSGSAPLAPEVQEFLRIVTGVPVCQGYGLTETGAALTVQNFDDQLTTGHVGAPLICSEVKLVDVPEMGYISNAPVQRGEICVRGPSVFGGYYKEQEKTKEAIDDQGWFHTGDIGEWLSTGALKIIDRKKNIFKLAQGEYVAAEYLETLFQRSKYVMQIFVYGDSFKTHLVAIIVPDPDVLVPWAKANGIASANMQALCNNPRVQALIAQDLNSLAVSAKLPHFMYIKNFHLEADQWTVENGMLTPSMKLKRPQLKDKYLGEIDKLYKEHAATHHAKL